MVDVALQQMEAMLRALMSTDNAVRNQAEEALAQARQAPDSLFSALIAMLRSNQDEQVRSLAAVLLRKEIIRLLAQSADAQGVTVSTQVKALLKSELLACIEQEPQRSIRKKASDVVGQLAINIMSNDPSGWPELFPWMLEGTRSTNVPLHEAALAIFNTLSEFIAEKMAAHHGMLLDVFRSSLQAQQELSVRNAALRALASFLMALSEPSQRVPFQELVPLMLQTISDALARGMEDECREALEVFVEVAESQTKFLKRHLAECVTGMIAIASNTSLDDSLRHLALEFLLTIAEGAPTLARKMPRFCADTVPVALAMMLELECDTAQELQEWEDEDEDEEDTEVTNYDVGEEALDRLAIALGGKAMMPVLFGIIQEWFPSDDWKKRHAALMAISQSGEGCEAQMAKQLEPIVTTIVTRFGDAHPRVRWAAINTIGQMSTDFGPQLQAKLHSCVLPALVSAMDDGCKRVKAHAAAAVINFCEHCERKTLRPYLQGLLGKLMQLLSTNQRRVQEQAVTAVASVADVAEQDFVPFYDAFIPGLKELLRNSGGKEYRMLRGKAMECISLIGVAVGKDKFGPDAKDVMELLIKTQQGAELDTDDPQVSFMLQACARICKCLGEHFQPYLPFVIPPLLASAQLDPELHVTDVDDEDGDQEDEEGMESVTVNIRGQGNKRITIRTSALEEKATACSMLHSYVADLKEAFFPYVQEVAKILVPLIKFQYMDEVRTAAMMAMPELLDSCILALAKGASGASAALVSQLLCFMLEPILEQLKAEPDVETLACQLEAFGELLAHGGSCEHAKLSADQIQKSTEVLQMLMRESNERRDEREGRRGDEDVDDEEEEQLEGEAEREEIVMQSLVEAAGKLFEVYQSGYLPYFDSLLMPTVSEMLQPTAIASSRAAALCLFDDVIEHCSADGGSSRYIAGIFPALLQYMGDESTEVRQAAAYGIAMLGERCNDATFTEAMMQQAAQALVLAVDAPGAWEEEHASASDNAISALGKICKRSDAIGVVGWPRWLEALPLRADREEARHVHATLCEQVEKSNTQLLGANHERLPDVICVFGRLLGTDLIADEYLPRIGHLLKQVHSGLPQVLQQLPSHPKFALLSEENRAELEKALSS